ncbi:hypothetical protein POVCU1_006120 [Plasmodium ovale curtisi]|uniref:Uncharacterized protein n=1 Tax=Plasmodium ovale curtisi TaxID=864141 RepID=A0A1A8VMB6_PLAOA|nr:hypothetical protein POVCU1_006120 [Plasmodium ovale curtisi]
MGSSEERAKQNGQRKDNKTTEREEDTCALKRARCFCEKKKKKKERNGGNHQQIGKMKRKKKKKKKEEVKKGNASCVEYDSLYISLL